MFFTEFGFGLPRLEDSLSVASAANDARRVIDTIETGGKPLASIEVSSSAGWSIRRRRSRKFSIRDLATVAQLTGGVSSAYSNGDKAVAAIDQATTFEYLLGYYPTDPTLDGRHRRVTVVRTGPASRCCSAMDIFHASRWRPWIRRRSCATAACPPR